MGKISRPTHQLAGRLGQITKAPQGMVKQYQTAAQPRIKILSHRPPTITGRIQSSRVEGSKLEEREARLRALTTVGLKRDATGVIKTTVVSDHDDAKDCDTTDLFDERPAKRFQPNTQPLSSPPLPAKKPIAKSTNIIQYNNTRPLSSPPLSTKKPFYKSTNILRDMAKPRPAKPASTPSPPSTSASPPPTQSAAKSAPAPPSPSASAPAMKNLVLSGGKGPAPKPRLRIKRKPVDIFNRGRGTPR